MDSQCFAGCDASWRGGRADEGVPGRQRLEKGWAQRRNGRSHPFIREGCLCPAIVAGMVNSPPSHDVLTYAATLRRETWEEIGRADAKATTLLGASGIFVGALTAGAIAGDWTPATLNPEVAWMFWFGLGCLATAIGMLAFSITPRLRLASPPSAPTWWGEFAQLPDAQALQVVLRSSSNDLEAISVALLALAQIATTKHRLLLVALIALAAAATLCFTSILVDATL